MDRAKNDRRWDRMIKLEFRYLTCNDIKLERIIKYELNNQLIYDEGR